jgi:adenylate cyclase
MTRLVAIRNMTHNNSDTAPSHTMPAESEIGLDVEALSPRQLRTVLVCDVVESVRWMEHDEDNAITRWSQFAAAVRGRIAPEHAGSVVKSTGDGLMLEFESAPQAVAAAHTLHSLAIEGNQRLAAQDPERQLHLRIGIHQAEVRKDAHDLYGHGVNLAARITTLAGPGEIIVTPEVRDHITDSLDGEIEDLGECYLKHLSEPQRVYRVNSPNPVPAKPISIPFQNILPLLAVLTFEARSEHASQVVIGALIADSITVVLSRNKQLRLCSRLSAAQARPGNTNHFSQQTKSDFLVYGSFISLGANTTDALMVTLNVEESASHNIIFAEQYQTSIQELLSAENDLAHQIATDIHRALSQHAVEQIIHHPAPNVPSYAIHLGAIKMMHHTSKTDFSGARQLLEQLSDRFPRWSQPYTWLAKWQMLNVEQGWSTDSKQSAGIAKSMVLRAIDHHFEDALAHTMHGIVHSNLLHDLPTALKCYEQALSIDPNESFAWLSQGMAYAFMGHGGKAVSDINKAIELSPIDPLAYYYQSLLASAYLTDNQYARAIQAARKSLRLNALHASTLRVLTISQVLSGDVENAQKSAQRLLSVSPQLTVNSYLSRAPAAGFVRAQEFAQALGAAGVPQN